MSPLRTDYQGGEKFAFSHPPNEVVRYQYRDAVADALHGMIVLEDDPFRMRVKRQIAEWKEGPKNGEAKGVPTFSMDPMTGQMAA